VIKKNNEADMRIGTKLILWYAGLLAIVIVIFGASVYSVMDYTLIAAVDNTLNETANQVIQNSRVQRIGEFGAPDNTVIWLPRLDIFRASGVGVQVWDLSGDAPRLATSSVNLDYVEPLDSASIGQSEPTFKNTLINGQSLRVLTRPVMARGTLFANVQVVALLDTVNDARQQLLFIMVFFGALGIVGAVILGMWLSRKALQPINEITLAAAQIAKTDDLSTRLPWNGPPDELGRLTSVFNEMMGRLQELFSVQQRFVADVSHELRTPLTAIRGNLDLVRRYGMDDLSLEAIESETERMSRMVNDLLLLARADYGGLTLDLEPVDLDTVILETHREGRVLIKDRDLKLTLERVEPVRVNGNADRVKQLVLNLVSNAIKFTPDGGSIFVRLEQIGDHARITVRDTGIGISQDDIKHIFDRFYQADESRKRTGDSSGLGLSIAKWIVEAHHGSIRVESEVEVGSTFMVDLPLLDGDALVHLDEKNDQRRLRRPNWLMPER
jgi:heavy metal sensor kinase